jgi:NAD(P)-dependent dehydrogenase (short-subunit alcohol dehydrogenase family)
VPGRCVQEGQEGQGGICNVTDEWIRDKVILITGAASGIGAATAPLLAARGAKLVLTDLDAGGVARVAAETGDQIGRDRALALSADVTQPDDLDSAVATAVARFGRIDVVWANAGIASFGPLASTDPAAWVRTIEVNLVGAFRTVRAALPQVVQHRGHVAVTASLASFVNAPCLSAYAATKSGVEAMCNSLRIELAHHGVTVGAIHPSWIATPLVGHAQHLSAFNRLRAAMPAFLRRDMPLADAAAAIARGIAERRARVYLPGWVRWMRWLRTPLHSTLGERDMRLAMPDVEVTYQRDLAARGVAEASMPEAMHGRLGAR